MIFFLSISFGTYDATFFRPRKISPHRVHVALRHSPAYLSDLQGSTVAGSATQAASCVAKKISPGNALLSDSAPAFAGIWTLVE